MSEDAGEQYTFDPYSPTGVGGKLEYESMLKAKWIQRLSDLRNQIRRTDVEMRHLTGDKNMKEFETELLRVLTLSKQVQLMYSLIPFITAGLTGDPLALLFAGVMGGMGTLTSASVMMEVS